MAGTVSPAQRTRAMAEANARAIGPRVPGGRYLCGYWQEEYTVERIASMRDDATPVFVVTWADGHMTSHATPWDARADRVVSGPAG